MTARPSLADQFAVALIRAGDYLGVQREQLTEAIRQTYRVRILAAAAMQKAIPESDWRSICRSCRLDPTRYARQYHAVRQAVPKLEKLIALVALDVRTFGVAPAPPAARMKPRAITYARRDPTITERLMGDPPPGRSALDRREGRA